MADLVVWAAQMKPPTLGGGRLVCVDGAAGSGKSTLGAAVRDVAAGLGSVGLVPSDDLLDGWGGLPEAGRTLHRDVLSPLSAGRPGRYRRYDWHAARFAEEVTVEPVDLLVVEGVGSWRAAYASWVTTLVWVDAPADLRLSRGVERDGEALRPEWQRWMVAEDELFRREHTREHADIVVDGTGEAERAVVLR
ncbi:MAG TPA: 4-amino-4-deoxy-L-arabinose transferase [Nocardioidaceae bacterium]|nr:4-amino-4-deoxy-L-arabinose transferase [Nocardioidaceae bacterium]